MGRSSIIFRNSMCEVIKELIKDDTIRSINAIRELIKEEYENKPSHQVIRDAMDILIKEKVFYRQVGFGARGSPGYARVM